MKTNQGFVTILISIIILAGIGGFFYYQNQKENASDTTDISTSDTQTDSSTNKSSSSSSVSLGLSPKEIFIKRITETNNAKDFEDVMNVMRKYDSKEQIAEAEADYRNASEEKKKALYTILQGFFPSIGNLSNIKEVITGDTATVTADSSNGGMTAKFIKENGQWKINDLGGL